MQYFIRFLVHLKITQPFLCFWVNRVFVFLIKRNISSPRWIFISCPVGFVVFLVENLLRKIFQKIWQFSYDSRSSHQGTDTGCMFLLFKWLGCSKRLILWENRYLCCSHCFFWFRIALIGDLQMCFLDGFALIKFV